MMSKSEIEVRVCTNCVMDTTDPEITFDSEGVCNHCRNYYEHSAKNWKKGEEGLKELQVILNGIKEQNKDKPYDSILGLSGGVDSSYLALKLYEWGMRPLVVHVDAGWNSELAVSNIEKIIEYCKFDLYTNVINWEEVKSLQLSFLKSGISNQDVPQDHVFFASLYKTAIKNNISVVFSGGNIATESIFPAAWHGDAMDLKNLKAINKKYSGKKLKDYTTINFFDYRIYFPFIKRFKTVRPLNYIDFNKTEAIKELEEKIGWRNYGRKHGESVFTKFFQNYYLPYKFGYDKRKPHLSSLIVSGQMTRDEALEALSKPLYSPVELEEDIAYFCKKLDLTKEEFQTLIDAEKHHYSDFPNNDQLYKYLKFFQRLAEKILKKKIKIYS